MKNFTKVCLMICLVFVCISAVCMGAGVALGSGLKEVQALADEGGLSIGSLDFGNHRFYYVTDEEDYDEADIQKGIVNEHFAAEDIRDFDMEIQYGEIQFTDSESEEIEVLIDAPKRNSYICKNDNGTLKIKDTTTRYKWYAKDNSVTVTIAIPAGKIFDEVDIATNAASVEVSHEFQTKDLELELDAGELLAESIQVKGEFKVDVGAGNVEIDNFSAESLEVDCGVGSASLKGSILKTAEADCGVGQIILELSGREEDYNYEVSAGVGSVEINGKSYSSLSVEKTIDNGADKDIQLDCGVGQIEVTVE